MSICAVTTDAKTISLIPCDNTRHIRSYQYVGYDPHLASVSMDPQSGDLLGIDVNDLNHLKVYHPVSALAMPSLIAAIDSRGYTLDPTLRDAIMSYAQVWDNNEVQSISTLHFDEDTTDPYDSYYPFVTFPDFKGITPSALLVSNDFTYLLVFDYPLSATIPPPQASGVHYDPLAHESLLYTYTKYLGFSKITLNTGHVEKVKGPPASLTLSDLAFCAGDLDPIGYYLEGDAIMSIDMQSGEVAVALNHRLKGIAFGGTWCIDRVVYAAEAIYSLIFAFDLESPDTPAQYYAQLGDMAVIDASSFGTVGSQVHVMSGPFAYTTSTTSTSTTSTTSTTYSSTTTTTTSTNTISSTYTYIDSTPAIAGLGLAHSTPPDTIPAEVPMDPYVPVELPATPDPAYLAPLAHPTPPLSYLAPSYISGETYPLLGSYPAAPSPPPQPASVNVSNLKGSTLAKDIMDGVNSALSSIGTYFTWW